MTNPLAEIIGDLRDQILVQRPYSFWLNACGKLWRYLPPTIAYFQPKRTSSSTTNGLRHFKPSEEMIELVKAIKEVLRNYIVSKTSKRRLDDFLSFLFRFLVGNHLRTIACPEICFEGGEAILKRSNPLYSLGVAESAIDFENAWREEQLRTAGDFHQRQTSIIIDEFEEEDTPHTLIDSCDDSDGDNLWGSDEVGSVNSDNPPPPPPTPPPSPNNNNLHSSPLSQTTTVPSSSLANDTMNASKREEDVIKEVEEVFSRSSMRVLHTSSDIKKYGVSALKPQLRQRIVLVR